MLIYHLPEIFSFWGSMFHWVLDERISLFICSTYWRPDKAAKQNLQEQKREIQENEKNNTDVLIANGSKSC
jgi:hypothetical protein